MFAWVNSVYVSVRILKFIIMTSSHFSISILHGVFRSEGGEGGV